MEWLPNASADVALVATPPESGELPRDVGPSNHSTLPVADDGVTVAVSVTLSPTTDGFGDEVTAVDVLGFVTECE
jgi:hypothetical protein